LTAFKWTGVEGIQAILEQVGGRAIFVEAELVVRVEFSDFDRRLTLFQIGFDTGQVGRDHFYRAVVTDTQEHPGRQQDLGFAVAGG
jgi:hypothetical protein